MNFFWPSFVGMQSLASFQNQLKLDRLLHRCFSCLNGCKLSSWRARNTDSRKEPDCVLLLTSGFDLSENDINYQQTLFDK